MGNKPSRHFCNLSKECKGRDDVVKDVRERVHDDHVDVIVICGAPMIGKSMVLIKAFLEEQNQLGSDNLLLYHNLDDCKEDDVHRAEEFWSLKINRFAKGAASNNTDSYKILLDRLISSYDNQIYLYLDNVDMLKKWEKLAEFLELVKDLVATHDHLKVVFSTSTQVPEITNGLAVVKVPELPIENISSIITTVCESKQVNIDESQKLYIQLIGTLCDGIPYIAVTAGSILSENQGLILPSELLELMIAQRLEVLSPTNYPTSSRFVALTDPISERSLNIEVRDFLSNITQRLKRSTFTEDEAMHCNGDTRDTAAMIKNSKLRPLLICCILAKDKKLCLPTVFKECKLVVDKNVAQEKHGENADEVTRLETCRLNLTRENLERLNLTITITDWQLENPKEVEKIIKGLMNTPKREPEENFDSFGSEIIEEFGLDCNLFGTPDVQTPDGKPEPTVVSGGSGSKPEPTVEYGDSGSKPEPTVEYGGSGSEPEPTVVYYGSGSQPVPTVAYVGNGSKPAPTVVYGGSDSKSEPIVVYGGCGSNPEPILVYGGSGSKPEPTVVYGGSGSKPEANVAYGGSSSKPELTVVYGGGCSGLQFVQLQNDASRKGELKKDTSSFGSSNYEQFSNASKELSEVCIGEKLGNTVSQNDLLSNDLHAHDVDLDYKGNEKQKGMHSDSNTTKEETAKLPLCDQGINEIHVVNNNTNTQMVRGEEVILTSSGPHGFIYVNNSANEIKFHAQISEDSGIEPGSDLQMRRTTD